MREKDVQLQWEIAPDDEAWALVLKEPVYSAAEGQAALRRKRDHARLQWACLALIVLLLCGIRGYRWFVGQAELAHAQMLLQQTIALETQTVAASATGGSAPAFTDHNPTGRRFDSLSIAFAGQRMVDIDPATAIVQQIELQGDKALVQLSVTKTGAPTAQRYRETRLYGMSAAGWVRIQPEAAFWGPRQTFDSAFFHYEFHQRDQLAVQEVAAKLDTFYASMRATAGLPAPTSRTRIRIAVRAEDAPPGHVFYNYAEDAFSLPSPLFQTASFTLTESAMLYQSLVLWLTSKAYAEAMRQYSIEDARWLLALRLWLLWEHESPLATTRADLEQWFYQKSLGSSHPNEVGLPKNYAQICDLYAFWSYAPINLGIPLTCTDLDLRRSSPLTRKLSTLLHPAYRAEPWETADAILNSEVLARATVFAYIAETYGVDRIPALLAVLNRLRDRETALQAALGVPFHDFEAGWSAYFQAKYGRLFAAHRADFDRK